MKGQRNLSMAEDEFDYDEDPWEPTEDYPTKKSWEEDNWTSCILMELMMANISTTEMSLGILTLKR